MSADERDHHHSDAPDSAAGEGQRPHPRAEETTAWGAPAADAAAGPAGGRIGPYRLLRRIGEGGMGEVWEAEQDEPVRRRVALKLIKLGMDTQQVVARFESERQALALMNHPFIARVFDAGATEQGRPYFAMELVRGVTITDYCDKHRLGIRRRLELFTGVCDAIHHAHQKGIIHRDIKPSNVLVRVLGDEPQPKVIDFGVAKATTQRLTDKTLHTELGQLVGTPQYMSPEQAEMGSLDIDTRTDVYSLGALLYELLTGAKLFDPAVLRGSGVLETARILREEEPPAPSSRPLSGGAATETAARLRRCDPKSLERRLRGDLDRIVMKAIEKDRTRRYDSAAELGRDVRRHLADEPVLAGSQGSFYRAGKFVRRHRAGAAAASILVMLLAAFGAAMWVQSARVTRERDRAEVEATRAVAFREFVEQTILSPDPVAGLGREVTVAETLAAAAGRIEELAGGRPEVEASLQRAIGSAFLQLGRYGEAEPLLVEALATSERVLGREHPQTADSLLRVGVLHQRRGDNEGAEAMFRRALAARRARDPEDPATVDPLENLAELLIVLGRYDEAEPLVREALTLLEENGLETAQRAEMVNKLGIIAWNREDFQAAESYYRQALALRRAIFGNEHAQVAAILNNLGVLLYSTGDYPEAEEIFREVLRVQRKAYGEGHEEVATAMGNLAALVRKRGGYEEAEELLRGALAINRAQLGEGHSDIGIDLANLGELLIESGRPSEALPLLEKSVAVLRAALEPGHWRIGAAQQSLGYCLGRLRRFAAAERELLEGIRILEAALGPESQRSIDARQRLAVVRAAAGTG